MHYQWDFTWEVTLLAGFHKNAFKDYMQMTYEQLNLNGILSSPPACRKLFRPNFFIFVELKFSEISCVWNHFGQNITFPAVTTGLKTWFVWFFCDFCGSNKLKEKECVVCNQIDGTVVLNFYNEFVSVKIDSKPSSAKNQAGNIF